MGVVMSSFSVEPEALRIAAGRLRGARQLNRHPSGRRCQLSENRFSKMLLTPSLRKSCRCGPPGRQNSTRLSSVCWHQLTHTNKRTSTGFLGDGTGFDAGPSGVDPRLTRGIADAAGAWRIAGQAASGLSESVFAVSPADSWTGSSAEAFEYRRTTLADSWAAMAEALALSASACSAYEATQRWRNNRPPRRSACGTRARRRREMRRESIASSRGPRADCPSCRRFVDPGEADRAAAADILETARASVREAASEAAMQLRVAREATPEKGLWGVLLTGGPALSLTGLDSTSRIRPPGDVDPEALVAR